MYNQNCLWKSPAWNISVSLTELIFRSHIKESCVSLFPQDEAISLWGVLRKWDPKETADSQLRLRQGLNEGDKATRSCPSPSLLAYLLVRFVYGIQRGKHVFHHIVYEHDGIAMMAMTYLPNCSRDKTLLYIYIPCYFHNNLMRWFLLILFHRSVVKLRQGWDRGLRSCPSSGYLHRPTPDLRLGTEKTVGFQISQH